MKKHNAFTLTELLITIIILGIISVVAFSPKDDIQTNNVSDAKQIMSWLVTARSESILHKNNICEGIYITPDNISYQTDPGCDNSHIIDTSRESPNQSNVTITAGSVLTTGFITFNEQGNPIHACNNGCMINTGTMDICISTEGGIYEDC